MKIKIEIKHFITGSILFEYEKENNTIKDTLIKAVRNKADLTGAYLRDADLTGAYLTDADLTRADLTDADLTRADLRGADLTGAYLRGADLRGAYLRGAYLTRADLRGADLTGAYLRGAYLTGADLTRADLRGADLTGADLTGAYLRGAKIKKAAVFTGLYTYVVMPYITEEGELRVKMGCHDRSVEEWDNDFWNNTNEFPNDGSIKSSMRLMAYNTAKEWLRINNI